MNSLKKPLNTGVQKVDSARALVHPGMRDKLSRSRCPGVACAVARILRQRTDVAGR